MQGLRGTDAEDVTGARRSAVGDGRRRHAELEGGLGENLGKHVVLCDHLRGTRGDQVEAQSSEEHPTDIGLQKDGDKSIQVYVGAAMSGGH